MKVKDDEPIAGEIKQPSEISRISSESIGKFLELKSNILETLDSAWEIYQSLHEQAESAKPGMKNLCEQLIKRYKTRLTTLSAPEQFSLYDHVESLLKTLSQLFSLITALAGDASVGTVVALAIMQLGLEVIELFPGVQIYRVKGEELQFCFKVIAAHLYQPAPIDISLTEQALSSILEYKINPDDSTLLSVMVNKGYESLRLIWSREIIEKIPQDSVSSYHDCATRFIDKLIQEFLKFKTHHTSGLEVKNIYLYILAFLFENLVYAIGTSLLSGAIARLNLFASAGKGLVWQKQECEDVLEAFNSILNRYKEPLNKQDNFLLTASNLLKIFSSPRGNQYLACEIVLHSLKEQRAAMAITASKLSLFSAVPVRKQESSSATVEEKKGKDEQIAKNKNKKSKKNKTQKKIEKTKEAISSTIPKLDTLPDVKQSEPKETAVQSLPAPPKEGPARPAAGAPVKKVSKDVVKQIRKNYKKQKAKYQAELDVAQQEKEKLTQQLTKLQKRIGELQEKSGKAVDEMKREKSEKENLSEEYNNLSEEHKRVAAQLQASINTSGEIADLLRVQKSKNSHLHHENKELSGAVEGLSRKNQQLRQKVQSAHETAQEAQATASAYEDELERVCQLTRTLLPLSQNASGFLISQQPSQTVITAVKLIPVTLRLG